MQAKNWSNVRAHRWGALPGCGAAQWAWVLPVGLMLSTTALCAITYGSAPFGTIVLVMQVSAMAVACLALHAWMVQGAAPIPLEAITAMQRGWHASGAKGHLGAGGRIQPHGVLHLVIRPRHCGAGSVQPAAQTLSINGPCVHFDGRGAQGRQQVWVAGGNGIAAFMPLLQARLRRQSGVPIPPVQLHYCSRDARHDPVVPRLQSLCADAWAAVQLTVHDAAVGEYFSPEAVAHTGCTADVWLCGPHSAAGHLPQTAVAVPLRGALRRHAPGQTFPLG